MTTIKGIIGYECDGCSTHHHCDASCDRSELPTGWRSRDSKDIHVCEECDLLDTIRELADDWKP